MNRLQANALIRWYNLVLRINNVRKINLGTLMPAGGHEQKHSRCRIYLIQIHLILHR